VTSTNTGFVALTNWCPSKVARIEKERDKVVGEKQRRAMLASDEFQQTFQS